MNQQKPKHDLERIKKICEQYLEGIDASSISFPTQRKSLDCVVEIMGCDLPQATEVCLKGILKLQPEDFSQRFVMWDNPKDIADVYGLENYEFYDWYVKFALYEDNGEYHLEEFSFHLPVNDL